MEYVPRHRWQTPLSTWSGCPMRWTTASRGKRTWSPAPSACRPTLCYLLHLQQTWLARTRWSQTTPEEAWAQGQMCQWDHHIQVPTIQGNETWKLQSMCTNRSAAWHEVRRNRDLPGFTLDDALVLASELHTKHAEVCSSKVQCVEQAFFTPKFSRNKR